jgi:hypothetical protein
MNPTYGTSYVTAGFLDSLTQSRHLTALGIHNHLLIETIKLAVRVFGALVSAMSAFTPLGGENLAQISPYFGIIIFALAIVASAAIMKKFPAQGLPLATLILYAVGRSFGIPSAEPRFTHMEVAWGIITLVCALYAGLASANRVAIITGAAAVLGLLAFNVVSYNATILRHHSILQRRDDVDREAFYRIKAAASKYPAAQVVLINDHEGMWSARSMLILAGFKGDHLEILPTISSSTSTDTLHDFAGCPASTRLLRLPSTLQIRLDYPAGCAVYSFGREMGCSVNEYTRAGRFHSAAWAAFLQHPEKLGLYPSPLIHDVPIESGKPLVVITWRDRLSVPDVSAMPDESAIPLDGQATR